MKANTEDLLVMEPRQSLKEDATGLTMQTASNPVIPSWPVERSSLKEGATGQVGLYCGLSKNMKYLRMHQQVMYASRRTISQEMLRSQLSKIGVR